MKRIIAIVAILVALAVVIFWRQSPGGRGATDEDVNQTKSEQNDGGICSQDAKRCPDGTFVGRVSPSCEFQECPSAGTTTTPLFEDGTVPEAE